MSTALSPKDENPLQLFLGKLAAIQMRASACERFLEDCQPGLAEWIPVDQIVLFARQPLTDSAELRARSGASKALSLEPEASSALAAELLQFFADREAPRVRDLHATGTQLSPEERQLWGPAARIELSVPVLTNASKLIGVLVFIRKQAISFNRFQIACARAISHYCCLYLESEINKSTQHHEAGRANAAEQQFHALMQATRQPLCRLNLLTDHIVDMNQPMRELLRDNKGAISGTRVSQYFKVDLRDFLKSRVPVGAVSQIITLPAESMTTGLGVSKQFDLQLITLPNASQHVLLQLNTPRTPTARARPGKRVSQILELLQLWQPGSLFDDGNSQLKSGLHVLNSMLGSQFAVFYRMRSAGPELLAAAQPDAQKPTLEASHILAGALAKVSAQELRNKAGMLVHDPDNHPFFRQGSRLSQLQLETALLLPVRDGNRTHGMLVLYYNRHVSRISPNLRPVLRAACRQLVSGIRFRQIRQAQRREVRAVKLLSDLNNIVLNRTSLKEVVLYVAARMFELIDCDFVRISLYTAEETLQEQFGVAGKRGWQQAADAPWQVLPGGEAFDLRYQHRTGAAFQADGFLARSLFRSSLEDYLVAGRRAPVQVEVFHFAENAFSVRDMARFRQLISLVSDAHRLQQRMQKLQDKHRETVAYLRCCRVLADSNSASAILQATLRCAGFLFPQSERAFYRTDPVWNWPVQHGNTAVDRDWRRLPGVREQVLQRHQQYVRSGILAAKQQGSESMALILTPVRVGGFCTGVLAILLPQGQDPSSRQRRQASRLAALLSLAALRFAPDSHPDESKPMLPQSEMEQHLTLVAHDLRSPAVSIQGFADMLLEEQNELLKPEAVHYIERIRRNAIAMEQLVQGLLEYSMVAHGPADRNVVDMRDIVDRAIAEHAVALDAKFEQVRVQPSMPPVQGDAAQLVRVFSNLIGNAVKYTDPDKSEHRLTISAERTEREVVFQIKDNGIGIAKEAHEEIFNIFSRTENAKKQEGSGLGLAIVRRIVEQHHGNIHVESEPGKGATFVLRLPGLPDDVTPSGIEAGSEETETPSNPEDA